MLDASLVVTHQLRTTSFSGFKESKDAKQLLLKRATLNATARVNCILCKIRSPLICCEFSRRQRTEAKVVSHMMSAPLRSPGGSVSPLAGGSTRHTGNSSSSSLRSWLCGGAPGKDNGDIVSNFVIVVNYCSLR